MTENINKDADDSQDSLVDALESIKNLLAKSDSKLAAARESIAIASNQTALGKLSTKSAEQIEIPTLDDIIEPFDTGAAAEEVSNISDQISEKIEETLAVVSESIPSLDVPAPEPKTVIITKHDPQVTLDYLDTLQETLGKSLHNSLIKSLTEMESKLKNSLASEIDKIREQVKNSID